MQHDDDGYSARLSKLLRRAATDFLEQPALPVCREVLTSGR